LAREDIWKIVALHPTSHFLIYTSGAQFWQRVIELERLSNIFIFFSLKLDKCGEEKGRDLGQILEYCQKHQLPFGISLLVTQENAGYITSENYLRPWIEIGARSLLFMVFRSFQDSNGEEFGHTMGSKQIFYLLQKIEYLRNLFRVPIMRGLTGHGVTDCRAANKILSISPSGEIQICPFAPISIGNIRDCSLEEALKSPVCRIIRFINKTNKFLLRNPCMNFCNLLSKVNGLEVHSP
jgi:MoaA/NifB/PqqE/SkfB family radical SAM enzyme